MKKAIGLVFALLTAVVVWQWVNILTAKNSLAKVVEQQLNFVDENSQAEVKQKLVDEARKLGITLAAADIQIGYEDTDVRSVAQRMTSKIATFVNKCATIQLTYKARLAGIDIGQRIEDTRIRQVQAQERQTPQSKQILDGIQ